MGSMWSQVGRLRLYKRWGATVVALKMGSSAISEGNAPPNAFVADPVNRSDKRNLLIVEAMTLSPSKAKERWCQLPPETSQWSRDLWWTANGFLAAEHHLLDMPWQRRGFFSFPLEIQYHISVYIPGVLWQLEYCVLCSSSSCFLVVSKQ